MTTIWDVLGIAPTTDESEIRRAYARELKKRRPDKDPQGFQELREAFDSAKRYATVAPAQWSGEIEEQPAEEPPVTSMVSYIQTLMQEHRVAPETLWRRDELEEKAQELAARLIKDEIAGLGALRQYLNHDMPDALEARKIFSLALASALSEQRWLNRSLLREVSAVMGWETDNYRSSQLPDELLAAFEHQIAHTDRENHWQFLARQYGGSRIGQLKWRLLTEKGMLLPWWARLFPDFVQQLRNQVVALRTQYPELLARLNPVLLETFSRPVLALSWGAVITLCFWGYTAYLPGHESPAMALQSGIMLCVVALFIWGYPALHRRCEAKQRWLSLLDWSFWCFSLLLLFVPVYVLFRYLYLVDSVPKSGVIGVMRIIMVSLILLVPLTAALWNKRQRWRTLPLSIMVGILMFPVLFIRQLPPLVNVLALLLLPMLYGILIEMVYFVG